MLVTRCFEEILKMTAEELEKVCRSGREESTGTAAGVGVSIGSEVVSDSARLLIAEGAQIRLSLVNLLRL